MVQSSLLEAAHHGAKDTLETSHCPTKKLTIHTRQLHYSKVQGLFQALERTNKGEEQVMKGAQQMAGSATEQ